MSHATLEKAATGEWARHNRLSLAGTSDAALPFFLNQHKEVSDLVFCLDGDTAGLEAAVLIMQKYVGKGYSAWIEPPRGKDFNEDLTEKIRLEKGLKNPVIMHKETSL
jgi:hypothetical protein